MSDLTEHRIQTYSGLYYDFESPEASSIRLEDIAHQLSNTCRFSGACNRYYSVAEHSVLVSRVAAGAAKDGLLHDAAEAYLWDIPRPAKPLYGDVYKELTVKCDAVIYERLNLLSPSEYSKNIVHLADSLLLNYEGNVLMPHWSEPKPELPVGVLDWKLGLSPVNAKRLFLAEACRLGLSPMPDYAPPLNLNHQFALAF